MSLLYFDASVVVKYYVTEPGSNWVRRLVDELNHEKRPVHTLATVILTRVEVPAAIAIIYRVGRISKRTRDIAYRDFLNTFIHRYQILGVDPELMAWAGDLTQRHPLKALDAIHLAAALRLQEALRPYRKTLTFVTGDGTLLAAARAEGLATDNPFDHVEES